MRAFAIAKLIVLVSANCLAGAGSPEIEAAITQFRTGKAPSASELTVIEANINAAIATQPSDERARYAKVLLDRANGDRKAAKESVEVLVKQSPEVAEYHATYGTLCFEVIGDAGVLPGDVATPLAVVLNELMQNAADHAFPRADGRSGPRIGNVSVRVARDDGVVEVDVVDDGIGLPQGFTIERSSGLGLSIVRSVAEAHGGRLTAHSEGQGRGSRFELRLPTPCAVAGEPG